MSTTATATKLASGDMRAIVETQHRSVRTSLRRFGVHEADVDDVSQDVFLSIQRRWDDFDATRSLAAWCRGFALRHAMRYRNLARFRRELHGVVLHLVDEAPDPQEQLESAERQSRVRAALAGLPEWQRTILIMAEVEGREMPEIAGALGIPLNTGYSRLRRARRALAELLSETLETRRRADA